MASAEVRRLSNAPANCTSPPCTSWDVTFSKAVMAVASGPVMVGTATAAGVEAASDVNKGLAVALSVPLNV